MTPAIVAAAAVAAVGALGALALGERPFLGLDRISPWVVFWAVGLFALLMLVPLAVHRRLSDSEVERDRRWELAVLAWGGIALAAGLAFFAIAAFAGFDRDEAVGALAIVGVAESVLVVGGILLLMLTTG
jgi:predicted membrane channel-forming protein YqfA (hemolysin III family)